MSNFAMQTLLRLVDRIVAAPRRVVIGAVVLAAIALVVTASHLRIDTSTSEMISAEVPFRQHRQAFLDAFPSVAGSIVAVIEGAVPERVEAAATNLAEALARDQDHFATVEFAAGDPFFDRHGLLYLPVDELADLTDRLAAAQPLLAALAEAPNLQGLAQFLALAFEHRDDGVGLVTELDQLLDEMATVVDAQIAGEPRELSWWQALQGDVAPTVQLVIAQPRRDQGSLAPAGAAIGSLRATAAGLDIGAAHGLSLSLTGAAVLQHEELQSVGRGTLLAGVLTTIGVATLLVWGLRSIWLIFAVLLNLTVGLLLTAAFATLAIGRLNLISVTFAILFVGLGVDFGIHMVLRFREALTYSSGNRSALVAAAGAVAGPLSLSALCAAAGFVAFVPTDYLGLAELGVISAAGMAIAWLTSLTLLPACLAIAPDRATPPGRNAGVTRLKPARDRWIVIAAGGTGLLAAFALPAVSFDFNPINLKDPASEAVRTFHRLAADPDLSPHVIDVLAPDLEAAIGTATALDGLDQVGQTITLASFVPADQLEKLDLIDGLAFYLGSALQPNPAPPLDPDARQAALDDLIATLRAGDGAGAQRLGIGLAAFERHTGADPAALASLETRLLGTLPALLERLRRALEAGEITLDSLPASLRDGWLNAAGQARILVRPAVAIEDNASLRTFADAVTAAVPTATGTPVIVVAGGNAVVGAFIEASWWAFGAITVLLALVLRRLQDILLVLVPLTLAVLWTAATAVILGLQLNFANVIVLPLLLGLGVSGAIHVVMRWRASPDDQPLTATSTPRAILLSALTTVASFGSLAVSDHRGLASMGLLLTIAILWSLVSTIVVLPRILALTSGAGAAPKPGPLAEQR